MSKTKTHIILNPASGGGKTESRSAEILRLIEHRLGDSLSLHVTQTRLEATGSAAEAIQRGCELIVAIGGDGTIQEVVNGFFVDGHLINPGCELGIINCGTGHGFAQSLGLPQSIESQVELLAYGRTRFVDVGRVRYASGDGSASDRYFVNECQFGIGGAVVERVQGNHKQLGGTFAFGLGALETLFSHKNQWMKVILDEKKMITERMTGVVIANGAYMGGGMNLAPTARLDDGTLKVLIMRDLSIVQRLWNFPRIYSGTHLRSPLFGYHEARSLAISSGESVLVEADGEILGTTPCEIEVIPSGIQVRSISLNGG
jgi:YegS/Rv2252/BmrU family lipid kinase